MKSRTIFTGSHGGVEMEDKSGKGQRGRGKERVSGAILAEGAVRRGGKDGKQAVLTSSPRPQGPQGPQGVVSGGKGIASSSRVAATKPSSVAVDEHFTAAMTSATAVDIAQIFATLKEVGVSLCWS